MNELMVAVAAFSICWGNPTHNIDGSELTNLDRTRVHLGAESRNYTQSFDITNSQVGREGQHDCWQVVVNEAGDYYTAMTALNDRNEESFYSHEIIRTAIENLPEPPEGVITMAVDCSTFECQQATVVQGVTATPVNVTWDTEDGPFDVSFYQWPDGTVPVVSAQLQGNDFDWVPTKAGIYFARVNGQTRESAMTHLLYIKLAPPADGGID